MEYREIGKTGLKSSIIGMGCEHLDGKPLDVVEATINCAVENGINYFDMFMPGADIRKKLGKAIAGKRNKIMIQGHICSTDVNQQYDISRDLDTAKRYFEDLLKYLDTDYIDFGMLFFMDSDEALADIEKNGILDYALSLKEQGAVKHLGASSHNAPIAKKLVERGLIDVLMFAINPAYDLTAATKDILELADYDFTREMDKSRMELYKSCEKNGVGITVMKSLCAGKLLSKEFTPFEEPMTVPQCIHYALSRPAVCSVLIGYASPAEVETAIKYFDLTEVEKDYSEIVSKTRKEMRGSCVYCSHCQPCPQGIDIAAVNKYLDIAELDTSNIAPSVIHHYNSLVANGADCIACGNCEERCPFDVGIVENMQRADELLGE